MLWLLVAEIIGIVVGYFIAAELIAEGIDRMEPLVGQGIAGGVVLGLLGSLPETIFVVVAVLGGSYEVAIGSAIGGNILLFTLGLGAVAVVYSLKWKTSLRMKGDYKVELYFLVISTLGIAALIAYGVLNILSGALLCMLYVAYVAYRYLASRHIISRSAATKAGRSILIRSGLLIAVGIVIAALLSGPFVRLIVDIAGAYSIPAVWLALVISPLAADLNENISGYRIAIKNKGGGSTAVVSYLGSKLQNNTLLLGLIGIIASMPVAVGGATPELLIVIAVNLIAFLFVRNGRLSRNEGLSLMALYFVGIAIAFLY